jgi:uncharacterized protein YdeI (YjbR/CyaY-like superfamily)
MTARRRTLIFRQRSDWRAWLREHHDQETEAWVAHVKKGSRRHGLSYVEGVEEALCFGWIDGLTHALDADFFLQRYSPRKPGSVWSESNKARVHRLIRQHRMTRAGLRVVEAAQANGRWQEASQFEDPEWIPEALRAALARRPGALEAYRSLPASLRRGHGYAIATAKRPETRARRIEAAIRAALERRNSAQPARRPRQGKRRKNPAS